MSILPKLQHWIAEHIFVVTILGIIAGFLVFAAGYGIYRAYHPWLAQERQNFHAYLVNFGALVKKERCRVVGLVILGGSWGVWVDYNPDWRKAITLIAYSFLSLVSLGLAIVNYTIGWEWKWWTTLKNERYLWAYNAITYGPGLASGLTCWEGLIAHAGTGGNWQYLWTFFLDFAAAANVVWTLCEKGNEDVVLPSAVTITESPPRELDDLPTLENSPSDIQQNPPAPLERVVLLPNPRSGLAVPGPHGYNGGRARRRSPADITMAPRNVD